MQIKLQPLDLTTRGSTGELSSRISRNFFRRQFTHLRVKGSDVRSAIFPELGAILALLDGPSITRECKYILYTFSRIADFVQPLEPVQAMVVRGEGTTEMLKISTVHSTGNGATAFFTYCFNFLPQGTCVLATDM